MFGEKDKNRLKILIIRLGAIGDVVHTTNTYRTIKQKYPQSEIHYLTTKTQSCFLENDPDIEKVWVVSKDDLKFPQILCISGILKMGKFDVAINLQPNLKTRLLVMLAGIKKQLIYKKTFKMHAVENFFQTAQKYFKDLKLADEMTIYLSEDAKIYANSQLKNLPRPIIALNAGGIKSPRQGRTYPVKKWLELGEKLNEKYGGSVILTGASEDKEALAPLSSIPSSVSYIGSTTIEQNAALLEQCDLVISGDSGPLHIASALKTKSIGLYGSMPISRTGTYGKQHISIKSDMSCVPCNRRKCKFLKGTKNIYTPCMSAIEIDEIIKNCHLESRNSKVTQ